MITIQKTNKGYKLANSAYTNEYINLQKAYKVALKELVKFLEFITKQYLSSVLKSEVRKLNKQLYYTKLKISSDLEFSYDKLNSLDFVNEIECCIEIKLRPLSPLKVNLINDEIELAYNRLKNKQKEVKKLRFDLLNKINSLRPKKVKNIHEVNKIINELEKMIDTTFP